MGATAYGARLARAFGARLTLLHAAVPAPSRSSFDRAPKVALRAEAAATLDGEHFLSEAKAVVSPEVTCVTELHFGDPATVICQRAEELGADLVIVGNRGLGMLDRFLLGSVSSAVTQRAPCSVLVVRDTPRREEGGP
jgi:nucleotide-binding universal stress UspA family protein